MAAPRGCTSMRRSPTPMRKRRRLCRASSCDVSGGLLHRSRARTWPVRSPERGTFRIRPETRARGSDLDDNWFFRRGFLRRSRLQASRGGLTELEQTVLGLLTSPSPTIPMPDAPVLVRIPSLLCPFPAKRQRRHDYAMWSLSQSNLAWAQPSSGSLVISISMGVAGSRDHSRRRGRCILAERLCR